MYNLPGLKWGDGKSYLIDLPFINNTSNVVDAFMRRAKAAAAAAALVSLYQEQFDGEDFPCEMHGGSRKWKVDR